MQQLVELLESGRTLEALEQHYAADALFFENREMVSTGKAAAIARERVQLAALKSPPKFKVAAWAVDEDTGIGFIEVVIRFEDGDGRPQRLEQILSQRWVAGLVQQERALFEGIIDEGDEMGQ